MSARKRWSDLSERNRTLIVTASVVDGILKIAAVLDLRRRPAEQIRGSKRAWATAIVLVNSIGAVPIAYFVFGRRAPNSD
ncbi:PLD nuclease N-terminal domain-containing protein [Nocardia sp. NPDC046473]|uniref:PLD nuclease N-terminal domain-containing protein n=1 Tax=Nocardia sp. NPDC046473 TaxID=3155733 RepID=UPI0033D9A1D6